MIAPTTRPTSADLATQVDALTRVRVHVELRAIKAEGLSITLPSTYLVLACRQARVVRFERGEVREAFTTARRLRQLGWAVAVLGPGSWA